MMYNTLQCKNVYLFICIFIFAIMNIVCSWAEMKYDPNMFCTGFVSLLGFLVLISTLSVM